MNYKEFDDERLKIGILQLTENAEAYQKTVDQMRQRIADYQAELDNRAIEAYWQAHPDLTPVKAGDVLAITPSFLEDRESHGGRWIWSQQDRIVVSSVWLLSGELNIGVDGIERNILGRESVGVSVGSIAPEIVSDMRRLFNVGKIAAN